MHRVICFDEEEIEVPLDFAENSTLFRALLEDFGDFSIELHFGLSVFEDLFGISHDPLSVENISLRRLPLLLNAANYMGSTQCIGVILQALKDKGTDSSFCLASS